jgi:amino acid permease
MLLTMHCAILLLQTRKATQGDSFSEIGEKLYGSKFRVLVDLCLIGS